MRTIGPRMHERIRHALAGLVLLALVGCASPPRLDHAGAPDAVAPIVEIVPREYRSDLAPGTSIVAIDNPHGDVRVRITDQAKLGYYATVQRIGAQPLDPAFLWQREGERLRLSVRYPGEARWPRNHGHSRGRVDLAVFVPASVAL